MRALFGIPFATRPGGAERILWSLLRNRDAGAIDPHVLFFEDGPWREEITALGIGTTVVDPGRFRSPWRLAGAVRATARLIGDIRPDVAVSWLPRVQTVLAPAARLRRTPVVYFEYELPRPWTLGHLALVAPADWVVACSQAALDADRALWPHRDGTVVHPGIERPPRATEGELAALRERLGLPAGRPVVGISGRLVGWKGQDRLIEAVGLLRDRGVEVTLLVVGGEAHGVDPGIEARLRALADRLGLGERVVFTGHVAEPYAHVQLMDVLVNASLAEPFGIVIPEAMALGVPVVGVASGGPAESIVDGVSGLLARTGAPADLADAVARMVQDGDLRARLAEGGAARYRERYTIERFAVRAGEELRRAAGRRKQRPRASFKPS